MRNNFKYLILGVVGAALLTGCQTDPRTGQIIVPKLVKYGGISAAACAAIGGVLDGKSGAIKGGLGCGLVGGAVGAYMDHQERELKQKLQNTPVQVQRQGDNINLVMPENITFPVDGYQLSQNSMYSLSEIAQVLATYSGTRINVKGYTDSTGSRSYNMGLSERRANSVTQFLVQNGVDRRRINSQGFGPDYPVASNQTPAGRQQNRRVEIQIIPNPQQQS